MHLCCSDYNSDQIVLVSPGLCANLLQPQPNYAPEAVL